MLGWIHRSNMDSLFTEKKLRPGNLLRTGAPDEYAGDLPHRTSAQEGKRPSVCQVEKLQQCVQFVDTTSRP